MAGEGQHIDVLLLHVDVQMAHGLHGVGVEQDALFMADRADLRDGQDGADFVVGVHDGHQAGVRPDGVRHLLGGDGADGANRQQFHLEALFFQLLQGVENGVVFKSGGDDVLFALALADACGGDQSLIVRLAAAGGKGDLTGRTAQTFSHGLPCALQGFGGLLPQPVQAGGVAVMGLHVGQHGVDGRAAHFCRCSVIRVYHSGFLL